MLEHQLEAVAGGRSEGLLGVVAEVVAKQPATGRCKREGAHAHAGRVHTRTPPTRRGVVQDWMAMWDWVLA